MKRHTFYETKNHGQRVIFQCKSCGRYFSQTSNTFMAGIRKPIRLIVKIIKARTEGMGLNATCRVFNSAKNTLIAWEMRFTGIKVTLILYALLHSFLKLIIEGDELYTRVGKNVPPSESLGWTVVLMDFSQSFSLGASVRQEGSQALDLKALRTLQELIKRTGDITLITGGERRYGIVLFEICFELLQTGKRGRPRKTLKKGTKVRIKNKGSQAHKRGPKRPKYEAPCPEHPETVLRY